MNTLFYKKLRETLSPISLLGIAMFCFLLVYIALGKFIPQSEFDIPAVDQARKIIEICAAKQIVNCYDPELERLTKETGMQNAVLVLHALQEITPVFRNCHLFAHIIGGAATERDPDKWQELIQETDVSECGGGFLHGILVTHYSSDPTFSITAASIQEACNALGVDITRRDNASACSHLMGHLKLVHTQGGVDAALLACKDLPRRLAIECNNGVFMEDTYKTALAEHGLGTIPVRDEENMIRQRARCENYGGLEGISCWIDLGEVFAELYNYDAKKTFTACEGAPDPEERSQCYGKAALVMMSAASFDDSTKISSVCAPLIGSASRYKGCLYHAISGAIIYKFPARAATLCTSANSQFQEYCFKEIARKTAEMGSSNN